MRSRVVVVGIDCSSYNDRGRSYLSSGVDDLGGILLALVLNNSRKGVFDGGIVRFDKVILDELHRKRRLPCS